MTPAKTTTFDEAAYREDLVRAGLDPEDAAALAAKTAALRRVTVEGATMKHGLIKGGMPTEKAKRMADAHVRWNPTAPIFTVKEPAPPPVRVDDFQSMGDISA